MSPSGSAFGFLVVAVANLGSLNLFCSVFSPPECIRVLNVRVSLAVYFLHSHYYQPSQKFLSLYS